MSQRHILTAKEIDRAVPRAKAYKLNDGARLYINVSPSGSKLWRFNYTFAESQKTMSFGEWPTVGLAEARQAHEAARSLLARNIDPMAERQAVKRKQVIDARNKFKDVAASFIERNKKNWTAKHTAKLEGWIRNHLNPWLGNRPISDIVEVELVACFQRVADAGKLDTAQGVRRVASDVFLHGVNEGLLKSKNNPMIDPNLGKTPPPVRRHMAAILEPARVGQLMRDISNYHGDITTRIALKCMAYLFQRPGRLRTAGWAEMDLEDALWRNPGEAFGMKMRQHHLNQGGDIYDHLVPLPRQVVSLLRYLHRITGHTGLLFPGRNDKTIPISDNTLNKALRAMGYSTSLDITGHGFRAMARTLISEELDWDEDMPERHMAHTTKEELGKAYDRAVFVSRRRQMIQEWADYLDRLERGENIEEANIIVRRRRLKIVA